MSKNYRPGNGPLPLDPPADMLPLDAMAVIDAFAAACERSEAPPLGEWLQRYPEHAEALADYAAALFSEPAASALVSGTEQIAGELSLGTQRALDVTFGGALAARPERMLLRVAEPPSSYDARTAGILALARSRSLDLEQLAQAVNLSPQLLLWLDRTPIQQQQQPYPLVQRFAATLDVGAELVAQALEIAGDGAVAVEEPAQGNSVLDTTSVEEAICHSATLSAAQRAHWLAILSEDNHSSPDDEV